MFILDAYSLSFGGVSFFAYAVVRAVERCWRCPVNRYRVRNAALVDGQRMMLHTDHAERSVCLRHQLFVCPFIRRFRIIRAYREWRPVNNY